MQPTQPAPTDQAPAATLLCVDDEQNVLSSLRRLFRPLGYRVLLANGGAEGLRILERESVDLIISDMRMPEMDGAAFLEHAGAKWPQTVRLLLTGYADMSSTIAAINNGGIHKYISKPWEDTELKLSVEQALKLKFLEQERKRLHELTRKQNEELKDFNTRLEEKVEARTHELRRVMGMLETAHESLKKGFVASVRVFSSLIEMRGSMMAGHSRRVAEHARALARQIGMGEDDVQQVLFAGLLHDIGKIGLPDHLLEQPFDTLSPKHQAQVATHPVVGEGTLMALESLHEATRFIRSHHERYDGNGYPDGLRGDDIPLGARIITVADEYDALQQGMLYSERYTPAEARDFIARARGMRYDPEIVDAFLERLAKAEKQAEHPREVLLRSRALRGGMVLTRDLLTSRGTLLLPRGQRLEDRLIEKIRAHERSIGEVLKVFVIAPEGSPKPAEPEPKG